MDDAGRASPLRPDAEPGSRRQPGRARTHLMATAIDCFAKHGYQGTSIDRIASAAGVTKGALYYHFRDKEELMFEAVKDRIDAFERTVLGSVSPETDPAGTLAEIARLCVEVATRDNLRRFILTIMVESLDRNPQLSEAFRGIMRRFRSYLTGVIRLGQEKNVFRNDIDAKLAAQLFAGGVIGAELQHYQDTERVELGATMQGVVAQLLAWLTKGEIELPARTKATRGKSNPRRSK